MKFTLIAVLLAIGASCIAAQRITTWGDVVNTRILAQENVIAKSAILRVQNRTSHYRSVSSMNTKIISPANNAVCRLFPEWTHYRAWHFAHRL